jgi:hypothetical protein
VAQLGVWLATFWDDFLSRNIDNKLPNQDAYHPESVKAWLYYSLWEGTNGSNENITLGKHIRRNCDGWETTAYVTHAHGGSALKKNSKFLQNVVTSLYHTLSTPEKQGQI